MSGMGNIVSKTTIDPHTNRQESEFKINTKDQSRFFIKIS